MIGIGTRIVTGALIGRHPTGRTVAENDSPPAHQNVITTPTARRGTFGSRLTALVDAPSDAAPAAPSLADLVVHPSGVLTPRATPIFGGGGGRPVFGLGSRSTELSPAAGPADVAPLSITTLDAPVLVMHPVTATPVALPAPTRTAALAALPGSFISVAAGLISGVLNPGQFGGGPTAPVDPPMLWAVLAFVRRQFVNSTPTLNPTPTGTDPTTGLVYGNFGAHDADGDPVTFDVVTPPEHGAIDINQATGDYVYTPTTADYSGTDTFVVAVSDGGSDGVFGFLRPASGHTSATAITITVDPVTTTPPMNHPPTGSASATEPDPDTGTLTVTVVASDPDGQAVTITPPSTTGTLTPTGTSTTAGVTTNTYTYTPNQAARDAAAATMSVDTTLLTFTITDPAGVSTPAPVAVTIAPTLPLVDPTNPVTVNPVSTAAGMGAVTGQINTTNPATPVTYAVTSAPTRGTLVLNPDGSFTYTPDPVERVRANTTADTADDVDTFTITTTSATTSSSTVVVVPLSPTATALAYQIPSNQYPNGQVVIDQNTGTAYQATYDTGQDVTRVVAITPTGTTTSTVSGFSDVPVVVDPSTGTAYQTTTDSEAGQDVTRVAVITATGTIITTVPGRPRGAVVIDPNTGTAYQTTYDLSTGYVVRVAVITATETIITTVPGYANGPVVVDPSTGTAYQTTSDFRPART